MKILFFISVHGHGRGGHFNSLNHIANSFREKQEIGIISIGAGKSTILENNENFITHAYFNGINLKKLKKNISSVVDNFNPDIIHCFDVGCYNVIRLLYHSRTPKVVLSKCGGPNPIEFPYVRNLILFSEEDKEWFDDDRRYVNSHVSVIPNRVSAINTISTDISKPVQEFSFVRIARIGKTYKKSIFDCISLIDRLLKIDNRLKLKLFIIGVVESKEILNEIMSNEHVVNGTVQLLTEDKYTINASKMLYLADAVIGTGRSVMEAASLGIPTLTIDSSGSLPVLINEKTFHSAFKTNFSQRNVFSFNNDSENFLSIQKLVTSPEYYQELSIYMDIVFERYFNVDHAAVNYIDFYNSASNNERQYLLSDKKLILKTLYRFFRSSRKFVRK